jgi:hypothetical protein
MFRGSHFGGHEIPRTGIEPASDGRSATTRRCQSPDRATSYSDPWRAWRPKARGIDCSERDSNIRFTTVGAGLVQPGRELPPVGRRAGVVGPQFLEQDDELLTSLVVGLDVIEQGVELGGDLVGRRELAAGAAT